MQSESERVLIGRVQHGDLHAFESLYTAYSARIFALTLRLTGDSARARELRQDVFVRAWQNIHSFRGDSSFASWLHRVAVNVFLTEERAARRRRQRIETQAELHELPGATVMRHDDERLDLERAIGRLPAGARVAFVLHDIEGYTSEEIATLSGVTSGSVRAQITRARQLLRSILS